jgi:2-hydroxycyclohexanecarboxyl-CoA dehydrogenase
VNDTVTLVTGAGSGIGRATARLLAGRGSRVVCFDRDADAARETVAEIGNGHAIACVGDVRDRAACDQAVTDAIDVYGRITHLASIAGMSTMHSYEQITDEVWSEVLDINLKGPLVVSQAVAPKIAEAGGGAIVFVTSVEGIVIVTTTDARPQPAYNAAKGGLALLMKALAVDLAPCGIRVNAVAPGPVNTPLLQGLVTNSHGDGVMAGKTLLGRLAEPRELAQAIAFLLSDEASYITGVHLPVDGGWLTR